MKNFSKNINWLLSFQTIFFFVFLFLLIISNKRDLGFLSFKMLVNFFEYFSILLIISISNYLIQFFYRKRKYLKFNAEDNFILAIKQLSNIFFYFASIVFLLIFFEISPRQAFTSLSIVAAAIAIVFKDYLSNAINGMIMMFTDEISIGDHIEISEQKGKVINITLSDVHLINDDDDLIYIPNNIFLVKEVINYTKRPTKKISIEFEISYRFLSSIEEVESYLIKGLKDFIDKIEQESFNLKTVEIKHDFSILRFQYILKVPNFEDEKKIRKQTVRSIIKYMNEKEAEKID